jgi:hypothetical protein
MAKSYVMTMVTAMIVASSFGQVSAQVAQNTSRIVGSCGRCSFTVDAAGILARNNHGCDCWRLELIDQGIKTLSAGVFQNFTSQWGVSIDLSRNQISNIPPDVFQGTRLNSISFRDNRMISIPQDVFRGIPDAFELDLSNNQFALSSEWCKNVPWIRSLDLSNNQIKSLDERAFHKGCWGVGRLLLANNEISTIPAKVFQRLKSLWLLDLSSNHIKSLPSTVFQGLYQLHQLNISKNNITSVPPTAFQGLRKLREVDLSKNYITSVPSTVFQGLRNLQHVKLHQNNIKEMEIDFFDNLEDMNSLSLGGNNLTCLPYSSLGTYVTTDIHGSSSCYSCNADAKIPICENGEETTSVSALFPSPPKFLKIDPSQFAFENCVERRSWEDIAAFYKNVPNLMTTGHLGSFADGSYRMWACFQQHPCLSEATVRALSPQDSMCYIYNENEKKWYPWGLQSEVSLCNQ